MRETACALVLLTAFGCGGSSPEPEQAKADQPVTSESATTEREADPTPTSSDPVNPPTPEEPVAEPQELTDDEFVALMESSITVVSAYNYQVKRPLVSALKRQPDLYVRAGRIVPVVKNGANQGVKLYAIRPNSLYARLGFKNGDHVAQVNDTALTTPDQVLTVVSEALDGSELRIGVNRRGHGEELRYEITD